MDKIHVARPSGIFSADPIALDSAFKLVWTPSATLPDVQIGHGGILFWHHAIAAMLLAPHSMKLGKTTMITSRAIYPGE